MLEDDDFYQSDLQFIHEELDMIINKAPIIRWCKTYNSSGTPAISDKLLGLVNDMEDGDTWLHGCRINDMRMFDDIIGCYGIHVLCSHNYYSIPDLLHLNDFWCEVKLTY